jgi:hypothetical protein
VVSGEGDGDGELVVSGEWCRYGSTYTLTTDGGCGSELQAGPYYYTKPSVLIIIWE